MKAKKAPSNQLNLFDAVPIDYDQLVTDKANALLDLLNDAVPSKEKYQIEYYTQEGKFIILIASNRFKDVVCNVVDIYGNIPKDFSVNWRNYEHIQQEIRTLQNLKFSA